MYGIVATIDGIHIAEFARLISQEGEGMMVHLPIAALLVASLAVSDADGTCRRSSRSSAVPDIGRKQIADVVRSEVARTPIRALPLPPHVSQGSTGNKWLGGTVGLLIGAAAGLVVGAKIGGSTGNHDEDLLGAGVGIVVGGIAGALVGVKLAGK